MEGTFSETFTGLWIVRAKSFAEAEKIAAEEPFTAAGQRTIVVVPWQRYEGDTTFTPSLV